MPARTGAWRDDPAGPVNLLVSPLPPARPPARRFPRHSICAAHQYQLLGLVLGLAVYNRVLLDFALPMAAYKKVRRRDARHRRSDFTAPCVVLCRAYDCGETARPKSGEIDSCYYCHRLARAQLLGMPVGLRELTEMCPSVGKSLKQLLEVRALGFGLGFSTRLHASGVAA